jgi:hypothetical protein
VKDQRGAIFIFVGILGQAAMEVLRSRRALAFGLLAFALIFGAILRFQQLGSSDLNVDEGASWAAASAPRVIEVVAMEHRFDPGKLPLYDLLLHGWIEIFGDGVRAMRGMSAVLGIAWRVRPSESPIRITASTSCACAIISGPSDTPACGERTRGPPRVLILSGWDILGTDQIAAMEKCYPRLVARLQLVEVRAR